MSNFLKISEAASLGMHSMVRLAGQPGGRVSMAEIASELNVSAAHLSKVLQRLAKAGLVQAVRGPGGGYVLHRDADQTTLLEVYEAIEGELTPVSCLLASTVCGGGVLCMLGGLIERVNQEVHTYLAETTLADVVQSQRGTHVDT